MPACCAPGCENSSHKGFIMKRFPRDPKLMKKWAIKVNGPLWEPTSYSHLCEVHFAPDMWEKTQIAGKRNLKATAIPTLFLHSKEKGSKVFKKRISKSPETPRPKSRTDSSPSRDSEKGSESGTSGSARLNKKLLKKIKDDSVGGASGDIVSSLKKTENISVKKSNTQIEKTSSKGDNPLGKRSSTPLINLESDDEDRPTPAKKKLKTPIVLVERINPDTFKTLTPCKSPAKEAQKKRNVKTKVPLVLPSSSTKPPDTYLLQDPVTTLKLPANQSSEKQKGNAQIQAPRETPSKPTPAGGQPIVIAAPPAEKDKVNARVPATGPATPLQTTPAVSGGQMILVASPPAEKGKGNQRMPAPGAGTTPLPTPAGPMLVIAGPPVPGGPNSLQPAQVGGLLGFITAPQGGIQKSGEKGVTIPHFPQVSLVALPSPNVKFTLLPPNTTTGNPQPQANDPKNKTPKVTEKTPVPSQPFLPKAASLTPEEVAQQAQVKAISRLKILKNNNEANPGSKKKGEGPDRDESMNTVSHLENFSKFLLMGKGFENVVKSGGAANKTSTSSPETLPNVVNVLNQQPLDDPRALKSILNKVKSGKNRSVYVVPLKKKCSIRKLTKNHIKSIIENMPTVDHDLKERLLSILRGKKVSFQQFDNDDRPLTSRKMTLPVGPSPEDSDQICGKSRKICTCTLHCLKKRQRMAKIPQRVTPGLQVNIEGSEQKSDPPSADYDPTLFENAENMFSVSTILTNINDKSQIERLCQLVIESVFRLKNVNVGGTMSKIEIYIGQNPKDNLDNLTNLDDSHSAAAPLAGPNLVPTNDPDLSEGNLTEHNVTDFCEVQSEEVITMSDTGYLDINVSTANNETFLIEDVTSPNPRSVSNRGPVTKKNRVMVDLNFFHDHSYLSPDSQVLFEKPAFLVKLIDIDSARSCLKKSRIIRRQFSRPEMAKKTQRDLLKMRGQIARLRDLLKRKNENIEKTNLKLKYLGNIVCEEKGLKRIRFPKASTKGNTTTVEIVPTEDIHGGHYENHDVQTREIVIKPTKKKKNKIVLTPDFEVPPIVKEKAHQPELDNSDEFDNRLEYFYETYLDSCEELSGGPT